MIDPEIEIDSTIDAETGGRIIDITSSSIDLDEDGRWDLINESIFISSHG